MPPLIIPARVSRLTQRMLGTNDRPIMWSEFSSLLADIETVSGEIMQGGNTFGTAMAIGTNDNNIINFRVNGSTVIAFRATDIRNSTGVILKLNRQLVDASAITSLDWTSRQLFDSSGATVADWDAYRLQASDETWAINWNARQLLDATAAPCVDWGGRTLYSAGMLGTTLNWETGVLKNPGATVPNTSTIDWINCMFTNNNGVSVASWDDTAFIAGYSQALTIAGLKIRSLAGSASVFTSSATPEGAITSTNKGDFAFNVTDGDSYIKRTASGNTGWERMVHTGMINYKNDATVSYTVVASDDLKTIGMTNVAARAFILPNIGSVRAGFRITVMDEAGTASGATITISSVSTIVGAVTIVADATARTYQSTGAQWILIG